MTSFEAQEAKKRAQFSKAVLPVLTLTAPTGMTKAERTAWMHAAYLALGRYGPKLLARGAEEAGLKVDHPAKIVAAIATAIEELPDFVRRYLSKDDPAPPPADPEPETMSVISNLAERLRAKQ